MITKVVQSFTEAKQRHSWLEMQYRKIAWSDTK